MVREIHDSSVGDHRLVQLRESGGYFPPPPSRNSQPVSTLFFRDLVKQEAKKRAEEMKRMYVRKLAIRKAKADAKKMGKS